ncbi:MAG: hypothetical protein LWX83_07440 [Anaerolineae bacterium]|nr:hypothetical protein [Anaerolineae bacterium]
MSKFSSVLPIIIYDRPAGSNDLWQDFDRGPGIFNIREGYEIHVRIQNIYDATLSTLVKELVSVPELAFLNLSENRNISDAGLVYLKDLKQLKGLNLSSCSLTSSGLEALSALNNLEHLNLSYCNRITDTGLRVIKSLRRLTYLDLQGCIKTTHAGLTKIERRGLQIHIR